MQIFSTPESLKVYISKVRAHSKKVGLVPTMGALHYGHLELVRKAIESNDTTICSIYINPTQFNDKQDLTAYPRDLDEDIKKLNSTGCQVLFCPSDKVMYPEKPTISFDLGNMENVLEGRHRPGHFKGVALVVTKLLNMTQPDKAYFGEKDWQQLIIIKRLVQNLGFPLEIVGVPIIREPDGLAMSSRNRRLTNEQRTNAKELFNTITLVARELRNGTTPDKAKEIGYNNLLKFPEIKLEYLDVVSSTTLEPPLAKLGSESLSVCIAAFLGEVRLIDNLQVFQN